MSDEQASMKFINIPEPAGHYAIVEDFHIHLMIKPNWWFRKWTKLFLGWEWHDEG